MFRRTHLLFDQVEALHRQGQWSTALQLCERMFNDCVQEWDVDSLLEVVLRSAFLLGVSGNRGAAVDNFELAVTVAELNGDLSRAARSLNGLGVAYQSQGDLEASEQYYREALCRASAADDRLTRGDVEMNLGIVANIRGDLAEALRHYRVANEEYEAIANRSRLSKVLNNLGMLHIDLRQFGEADEALTRGLNITQSLSDLVTEGIIHANRTELFLATGNLEDARSSCDQAFEIACRLGDDQLKADVLKYYGSLFVASSKLNLAETHLRQSIALATEIGSPLLEAEATRELSLALRLQDKNREALEALNRAHALFSEVQARHDEADIAKRLEELEGEFLTIVARWGESIEAKDRYTSGHCERVSTYACRIAAADGMDMADLRWFKMGAFLHDVGKTEVPEEILNKPGRLTDEERRIMEMHTIVGDEMLSAIEFPWPVRPMIRSHHERWDGAGYPDKLAGDEIPYTARVLHIADVFDALTSTRSYRQPLAPVEALKLMSEDPGSYDPHLFALFGTLLPDLVEDVNSRNVVANPL